MNFLWKNQILSLFWKKVRGRWQLLNLSLGCHQLAQRQNPPAVTQTKNPNQVPTRYGIWSTRSGQLHTFSEFVAEPNVILKKGLRPPRVTTPRSGVSPTGPETEPSTIASIWVPTPKTPSHQSPNWICNWFARETADSQLDKIKAYQALKHAYITGSLCWRIIWSTLCFKLVCSRTKFYCCFEKRSEAADSR